MKRFPLVSTRTPMGSQREAAIAGPPSPLKENSPLPATVVMIQRSSGGKAAIPAEGKSTIAGDSGNDSSGSIHTADAAVLRVGDEEIAVAIKGDFTREIQPGAGGRTAVAAVTAAVITPRPAASKCGDNPCGSIHAADLIIELIDKKDVSFSVYGDPVGQIVDAY